MVSLREVVQLPGLGLRPIGDLPTQPVEVRWAHVSELVDPSPWLLGGELILTTGMHLDPAEASDYCTRLVNAGVAALGISTGGSLTHAEVPLELRQAAETAGLPLIHVPERTLLQSVVQRVSDELNKEKNTPLVDALATQRELSAAAAGRDGIRGVLRRLSLDAGFQCVVHDARLRTIAASDAETEAQFQPLKGELRQRLTLGLRWSMVNGDDVESVVALPLGTEGRLRGILVARRVGAMSTLDRATLAVAVSLLSVLLELREARGAHQQERHRRVIQALVSPSATNDDVTRRLRDMGARYTRYQVLALLPTAASDDVTALIANLTEHTDEIIADATDDDTVLLLCDPHPTLPAQLGDLVTTTGTGPAGLGEEADSASIRQSLNQARLARSNAQTRGVAFARRSELGGYRALLGLGTAQDRRDVVEEVLGALRAQDPSGELLATLRAYLAASGSIERAADEVGVHRHTVRTRLKRISTITGRDLGESPQLFELWLAMELLTMDTEG